MTINLEDDIKFNLHESDFIDYKIEGNDLIFRVAVNYGINGLDEDGDTHCIFDIICRNYEIIDDYGIKEFDIKFSEIACFEPRDDKYLLALRPDNAQYAHFIFKATSIEWVPIIEVTGDELYETNLVDDYIFEK